MKAWKIIRNSLLVLSGVVLVLLVALQILLRPSVLTGIVNDVAKDFVEGEVSFREVRAHVIKSFPYLNIDARDFSITYPHQRYARYDTLYPAQASRRFNLTRMGCGKEEPVDTLASFRRLSLSVNYMALLGNRTVHVRKLELLRPRIFAHYFDSTAANWDILPLGNKEDTTAKDSKPLPDIILDKILLTDRPILVFTNPKDTLHGMFTMQELSLDGHLETRLPHRSHTALSIDSLRVSGRLPSDTLALRLDRLRGTAKDRLFTLQADARASLWSGSLGRVRLPIHLETELAVPEHEAGELELLLNRLNLNVSALTLTGTAQIFRHRDGMTDLDVVASIDKCSLDQLAREWKDHFTILRKISTDAVLSLDARAKGRYGKGQMPSIDARVQIPRSYLLYEGLGRKGTLALDALVSTDDLKEVDCQVKTLFLDIVGAQLEASASARDVLGKDPLIRLDSRLQARIDSLTHAFTREMGILGTGALRADIQGEARLSQLNMARIGDASISANLEARQMDIQDRPDSLSAHIPTLLLNLQTKGNTLDNTLKKGTRILSLEADVDSLDVTYRDMFVRGGNVALKAQNSAEILKGSKDITPLMGILKVGSLQMRDSDGMDVALQDNLETFRIEPATQQRPTPRLSLRSRSGNLVASLGEDQAGLEQFHFDVSALRYTPRTPNTGRLNHLLDSLQRVYPAIPRDSLLRHARMERLQKEREQTWADKDVNISISGSLRDYLRKWKVEGNLSLEEGLLRLAAFPLLTRVSQAKGHFDADTLTLQSIQLKAGDSDLSARARLTGLRRALLGSGHSLLKLKADVSSDFINANQLLQAFASYSAHKPHEEQEKQPRNTGNRLLVIPSNLDVNFSLEAAGIQYDSLQVSWAAADIAMRNRTLQITNALAATNMGDMYFEGFYSTRSQEDIKAGFDLNLVNITAEKVIALFPAVDTLMPLLTTFEGDLDCELAVTTDLDTLMQVVLPSVDGTLNISGKDLGLSQSEELSKIANLLKFKNRSQARIDKMSVAGIVHDNVLEIFPFVMEVDRYQLAASGMQHLSREFLYHLSVIKSPLILKFGLNAYGEDFDHVHYKLAKPRYLSANVPAYTQQINSVKYNLVGTIHNIFDVGIDQALERNRSAATSVSALTALEEPPVEEEKAPESEKLSTLVEEVSKTVTSRREALRQEIIILQKEMADEQ